jgi:hypothetical protein
MAAPATSKTTEKLITETCSAALFCTFEIITSYKCFKYLQQNEKLCRVLTGDIIEFGNSYIDKNPERTTMSAQRLVEHFKIDPLIPAASCFGSMLFPCAFVHVRTVLQNVIVLSFRAINHNNRS